MSRGPGALEKGLAIPLDSLLTLVCVGDSGWTGIWEHMLNTSWVCRWLPVWLQRSPGVLLQDLLPLTPEILPDGLAYFWCRVAV